MTRPCAFPFVRLPVSTPPANGAQGVTVSSSVRAIGERLRLGVHSIKLYSICEAVKGVQPRDSRETEELIRCVDDPQHNFCKRLENPSTINEEERDRFLLLER